MKTYALKFEAALHPTDLSGQFYSCFDGLIAESFGRLLLTLYSEGHENGVMAAKHAAIEIERHLKIKVVRLDRDLVDSSEISRRIDRSRENVRQLVHGERRKGEPFPVPAGAPNGRMVWEWQVVNEWLRRNVPETCDPEFGLSRDEMTIVDDWILRWRCVPSEQHVRMEFHDIVAPGYVQEVTQARPNEIRRAWVKSWRGPARVTADLPLSSPVEH